MTTMTTTMMMMKHSRHLWLPGVGRRMFRPLLGGWKGPSSPGLRTPPSTVASQPSQPQHSFHPCLSPSPFSTSTTDKANPDDMTTIFSSSYSNVPLHIQQKVLQSPKLYQKPSHPLHTIKGKIEDYFGSTFTIVDSLSPIVTTQANFDSLLIPPNHASRSKSDTYYLTPEQCLRTHTSAHQVELLRQGHTSFLCTGDVYRKDDIDSSHYPIFHQMEGVKVFHHHNNDSTTTTPSTILSQQDIQEDLRQTLTGLALHLFGPVEYRWVDEYFPFTHPSMELEIYYRGEWLEVLGCGIMRPEILKQGGWLSSSFSTEENQEADNQEPPNVQAWAFGLGLERLAMVLFEIPDIRLFWSQDERFWNQFEPGQITKFQPYSKYPPCYKDVSFWTFDTTTEQNSDDEIDYPPSTPRITPPFHVNDFLDITRQVGGDLVEDVALVDTFVHPKNPGQVSHCYRITYRSMDRSLTNEEVDIIQERLRQTVAQQLAVQLR